MQKRFDALVVVLIIATALAIGGFLIYPEIQNWQSAKQEVADAEKRVAELKAKRESKLSMLDGDSATLDTSGWKTYRNEKYVFEFRHPQELVPARFQGPDYEYFNQGISMQWPTPGVDKIVIAPFKFLYTTDSDLINFLENLNYVGMRDEPYLEIQLSPKIDDSSHTIFEIQEKQNIGTDQYVILNKKTKQLYDIRLSIYQYGNNIDAKYDTANQILFTFKFIEPQAAELWEPFCGERGVNVFDVEVKASEGLTQIARKAISAYFLSLSLNRMPAPQVILTPEEKTYAEDYIVTKLIGLQGIKASESVKVECKLVEEATIKARLLTISQKQNLKQFSEGVTDFQILKFIQDIINQTSVPGGLQPYIFTPR